MLRLTRLLCHYQRTSAKRIAQSALHGLREVKHGLEGLSQEAFVSTSTEESAESESETESREGEFVLFEQRIVCRVVMCRMAHLYAQMLAHLLVAPLTRARLRE